MIIDCHCHAGNGDGLTGPWDTAAPLEKHLHRAAKAGIDRTVLFAAFRSDYAVANREMASIGRQSSRSLLWLRLRPSGAGSWTGVERDEFSWDSTPYDEINRPLLNYMT